MWFGKAVQDFNASIAAQGQQGPKLIATIGNAFTSTYNIEYLELRIDLLHISGLGRLCFFCHSSHYIPVKTQRHGHEIMESKISSELRKPEVLNGNSFYNSIRIICVNWNSVW